MNLLWQVDSVPIDSFFFFFQMIFINEKYSNLKTFPRAFGSIKNLIELLKELNISWEDLLMPVGNEVTSPGKRNHVY